MGYGNAFVSRNLKSIPTFVSQSTQKWIHNPKCPSSILLMDILLQCPVKKITTPD